MNDGRVIGTHDGLMYYTIGQRKGLGIGGNKELGNEPWFVIGKDLPNNRLIIGQGFHHPDLYSDSCWVQDINWIPSTRFTGTFSCTAKFRYRQKDTPVTLTWREDGGINVEFALPVRAVTPGQEAVFYDGPVCLGGGTIDQVFIGGKKRRY